MRPLTIAYVSVDDPADKRAWSGIHFHLVEALERAGHRVIAIGPLRPQPLLFLCRLLNQFTLRLLGKRFHYRDSVPMAKAYARAIERRLKDVEADILLAPAGLSAIARLRTRLPIVHFNDRSVHGALDYHAVLRDLLPWSRRQSLALELDALANAQLTIYTSEWAAAAARKALPARAQDIVVIPMGANLDPVPPPPPPRGFPPDTLTLLFIGVDWVNKGGPVAYDTLKDLKRRNIRARLVVCGCTVPAEVNDPDVVREGFLDKRDPRQHARLLEHLRTADIFILPTRFEAFGIAFCEAAAYGIPALGPRTGGVPTIIDDGVTGFLLDPDAGGAAYALRIEELVHDPERWQRMRAAARARFERHFTWDAFVAAAMDQVAARGLVNSSR